MAIPPRYPRQHPIPQPSHPKQFRAIGVVYGRYYPSEAFSQRGVLVTPEGSMVEAVLLGKLYSVCKHIDLDQDHFWVVYPRLRDMDDHLHFQLMGLWEPDRLGPGEQAVALPTVFPPPQQDRPQFSLRGEVVFVSQAKEVIIVKIRQAPKPSSRRPRFFKVRVQGVLRNGDGTVCDRPLHRFWDLQTTLRQNQLVLESGLDLGPLRRQPPNRKPYRKPASPDSPSPGTPPNGSVRDRPIPKRGFPFPTLKRR